MLNCSVFSGVESSKSSKFSRTSSGGASVSSGEGGREGEAAGLQRRPRSRERGPGRAPQGRKVWHMGVGVGVVLVGADAVAM
jgi:hypothetical protein